MARYGYYVGSLPTGPHKVTLGNTFHGEIDIEFASGVATSVPAEHVFSTLRDAQLARTALTHTALAKLGLTVLELRHLLSAQESHRLHEEQGYLAEIGSYVVTGCVDLATSMAEDYKRGKNADSDLRNKLKHILNALEGK